MCGCGITMSRWEWMWAVAMAGAAGVVNGRALAAAPDPAVVQAILKGTPAVDVHTHAGGLILKGRPSPALGVAMKTGGVAALCLASVPDGPVLGRDGTGKLSALRAPNPGELYSYHASRMDWMDELVAQHGVRRVLNAADLRDAHANGQPAVIQDIEGCDFLDGKLERLEEAHRRGVRVMQLVHYTPTALGDFQTGEVRHNGLTDLGKEAIRNLNRLGVLIDVAHGTQQMVAHAAATSTRPLLLSHTAIQGTQAMSTTRLNGRQISPEHAKLVAQTGGVIGLWHFVVSLDKYVDEIREMVDVVGVDHVAIGTDQQEAGGAVQDYAQFPKLVERLLVAGFTPVECGKLIGGNFLRVFDQATGAAG